MISPDMFTRMIAGLALSIVIAAVARSRNALSTSGSIAAVVVATAAATAGWVWAATLIAFFLGSTLLSRLGSGTKMERTRDIVAKGMARDASQVTAIGGPFALIAVASLVWPSVDWTIPGAGAIAASNADTWATELGMLSKSFPRSITTFREVPPGTSGGVTARGILGSIAGAAFIAVVVLLGGWTMQSACAALIGGVSGSFVDSTAGATIQEKRWCSSCGRGTERAVHTCGTATTVIGGVSSIGNDAVNFLSSIAGALIATLCLL
jgi:uncharacterized protein (TIGR00297 family)